MKHDDVTVVITCFNYGRYLSEAVDSARAQARVIVVDDGSTDAATAEALDRLPEDVEVLRQENAGVAAARNAGLAQAQTPYVMCLDADDRIADGAIDALRKAFESDPALGFTYGWMRFFGAWEWTWETPDYDGYKLLYRHQIGLSALMRRELVEATGGFDASFGEFEDWELWVNALEHGFTGRRVPVVALEYRKHESNKQTTDRRRYRAMYRKLREKHAALYARAGELATEYRASRADKLIYPAFWGARPLPARIESRLQTLAWRNKGV
jgi:glycosyltransferase involved in cell wall biosynthesis